MTTSALDIRDLVKCYGARRALDGLTLSVPRHTVTGLVGSNGAGKTTMMMTVAGFLRPTSGSVNLLGQGPFDAEIHKGRFAILPQDSDLPLASRPLELLVHYGRLQGLRRAAAEQSAKAMLDAVHLGDRLNSPIRALSHGMRKRVMMAQCFIGSPDLVLLDEPLSGLDPIEVAHMRGFILQRKTHQTIMISSHNLHDIEQVCDHVAFVEKGRTVRFARIDELTGKSNILSYQLAGTPPDIPALMAALPGGATLDFNPAKLTLICRYPSATFEPQEINQILLPPLQAQCGLIAITQGSSLEDEYLKHSLRAKDKRYSHLN
ncbi:MAG: ABC transporter ATP-binding protein [Kiritimatiellaeota bacterium]|nr:ABC transporter ATP-binding protein [Kiritimatiellota bacterium]